MLQLLTLLCRRSRTRPRRRRRARSPRSRKSMRRKRRRRWKTTRRRQSSARSSTNNPSDITREEYAAFYKSSTNDWEDHLAVNHFSVEGCLEFKAILYILKRSPFNLFESKKKRNNVELYVPRVFIVDDCEDFIRQNCKVICKNLAKKILDLFTEIAEDKNHFNMFYEAFSKNIKLGIKDDAQKCSKLAEVLHVHSIKSGEEFISLKGKSEFTTSFAHRQESIYYPTGESLAAIRESTFLQVNQVLKKKGFEVLLVDPIDEYTIARFKEFGGKKLICVSNESLELEEIEEKKGRETLVAESPELCSTVKDALVERVEKVVISNRITDSHCVSVTGQFGWSSTRNVS
ncbi:hypothetical protein CVT26_001546 [Gymnopilus dilepis]|uniref:Heat shock protein 90 n=1 Tax=Gymnopilus dilepis TaxID=231916 RepID=A0A409WAT0_9AGAR|nr:hypothetical protein CVT26_001546 [Gymnopilus dilepis]